MSDRWFWLGDAAVVREFEGSLPEANARAIAAWRAIDAASPREVADVVPAARSVTVALRRGSEPSAYLLELLEADHEPSRAPAAEHAIEVVYDGEDIAEVAQMHGMSIEDVVALHSSATYTVAFVGFSPGFGYLMGLPPELHTPRRDSPRTRVPAGSVAIGGEWTGIYPSTTPGGWRLIGRADVSLFDAASGALLHPGDVVRFTQP